MQMKARIAVAGTLGALLFGIHAPADAHYVYTLSGWIYHSVDCSISLKQLPNQTNHPGTVVCSVSPAGSQVAVWCANPAGYVFAGKAAVGSQSIAQSPISSSLTKQNGTASVTVATFKYTDAELQQFVGSCPNPNWHVVAVVVESFSSAIDVYDDTGALATHVVGTCALPPQYAGTIPPLNTAYVCTVQATHVS